MADTLFDQEPAEPGARPSTAPPQYAGFWYRALAYLVDSWLLMLVVGAVFALMSGWEYYTGWDYVYMEGEWRGGRIVDFLVTWVLPGVITILFWEYKLATPGKMLVSARIVDATTFEAPGPQQWIIRYLGYFVSLLPLGLGFLWIAFDPRKQGWHDKLAGTVVIFKQKTWGD